MGDKAPPLVRPRRPRRRRSRALMRRFLAPTTKLARTPDGRQRVRPQVVAHRGASEAEAEHTLAAYLEALDQGAEAVECDVRLTADGHVVCVHDRNLGRIANQRRSVVSTMELADLQALDVTTWKHPEAHFDPDWPVRDPELDRVLTLRRLLEVIADYDRPVEVAIETKHPTRHAGMIEHRVVDILAEFGWASAGSPARIMSFSPLALRRVRKFGSGVPLVLLLDAPSQWDRARWLGGQEWQAGPGITLVRNYPHLIRRLARRTPVHVWTVNTPADIELCVTLGVSAIITDVPERTLQYLRALGLAEPPSPLTEAPQ